MLGVPLVTTLAREMRLKFFEVDQALEMLRVPLVTILARETRLQFFSSQPSFRDVAIPLVTILAQGVRLTFFSSRPSFEDVTSAAIHDLGAINAIESFELDQRLEMRLKFFEVDQALEMLRVPLITKLAREIRLIFLKSTKLWRCCECRQSRNWREKCD